MIPPKNIANTVWISVEDIETPIVSIRAPPNNVQEADIFALQLSPELRIEEEKPFWSLYKEFSIALMTFSVSHANRFNRDISNKTIQKFQIGSGLNFSYRQLSSLWDYLVGPVWILGKNQLAQMLGLSINAKDFTVLWGPVWIYGYLSKPKGDILFQLSPAAFVLEKRSNVDGQSSPLDLILYQASQYHHSAAEISTVP